MPDVFRSLFNHNDFAIDKILGVNEQIDNMAQFKSASAEEKLYLWMTNSGHFTMDINFNEAQLRYA